MMRKLTLIFVLIFITLASYSQNINKTLLWKVTKNGSPHSSYLFGTFHHVNPDFFDSLHIVNKHLKESEILFVEINNLEQKGNLKIEKTENQFYAKWDKDKWKTHLNDAEFITFEKFSKSDWIDESIFSYNPNQLKFMLHLMYFQGIVDTANRTSYELFDDKIVRIAISDGLTIESLDKNIEDDLNSALKYDKNMSNKLSIESCIMFMNFILNMDTNNEVAKSLFDYKTGLTNYELNKNIKKTHTNGKRNDKWLKILESNFESKNCFVAVGINHLRYKSGLIQPLRKKGYIIQPVTL